MPREFFSTNHLSHRSTASLPASSASPISTDKHERLPDAWSDMSRCHLPQYKVHYVARNHIAYLPLHPTESVASARDASLSAMKVTYRQTIGISGQIPKNLLPMTKAWDGEKKLKNLGTKARRTKLKTLSKVSKTSLEEKDGGGCINCGGEGEEEEVCMCWRKEWGLFWVNAGHWLDDSRSIESYDLGPDETLQLQHRRYFVQLPTPCVSLPNSLFAYGTVLQSRSNRYARLEANAWKPRWLMVCGERMTWSRSKNDLDQLDTIDLTIPFILTYNSELPLSPKDQKAGPSGSSHQAQLTWSLHILAPVEASFTFRALDAADHTHWTTFFRRTQEQLHPNLASASVFAVNGSYGGGPGKTRCLARKIFSLGTSPEKIAHPSDEKKVEVGSLPSIRSSSHLSNSSDTFGREPLVARRQFSLGHFRNTPVVDPETTSPLSHQRLPRSFLLSLRRSAPTSSSMFHSLNIGPKSRNIAKDGSKRANVDRKEQTIMTEEPEEYFAEDISSTTASESSLEVQTHECCKDICLVNREGTNLAVLPVQAAGV
ncbi:uncharacterized protein VTP21DRAFT_2829 [Calcarisporiella thermophila]|uniref:uncharacterized protein n=1 Tax=Calcarisporiella thermophila TaxID=911321 RepID=UPI0037445F8E